MHTLVAHYRRTVTDSLRIAAHPACRVPDAYRSVARTNLALLVDARGRGQGRAPTDADALEMYRAGRAAAQVRLFGKRDVSAEQIDRWAAAWEASP